MRTAPPRRKALGIAGTLNLAVDTGAITFTLDDNSAAADPTLSMKVVHPTRPDQDQTVLLTRLTAGRYAGRMQPLGPANWKLEIHPEDKSWRIEGRLLMPGSGENTPRLTGFSPYTAGYRRRHTD